MPGRLKRVCYVLLCLPFFAQAQTELTLESIWGSGEYSPQGVRGFRVLNDGESYVQVDEDIERNLQEINRYAVLDGSKMETLLSNAGLLDERGERLDIDHFSFSNDEKKVLFLTGVRYIYRHSFSARFHIYDLNTKSLYHSGKSVRYATFSPDGSKVAYVYQNDLYYYDLVKNREVRVTKDGKENAIINGAVDWVYEEEFSMSRGYEWSPTGEYLAWYRFDESGVKEFSMDWYGSLYPAQERWKYPKAGEANSVVQVHIYSINKKKKVVCNTGNNPDIYLPRIQWTDENGYLSIQRLNRHQNHLELLLADARNGNTRVVYEEKNAAWIDINDRLYFQGTGFFFTSEQSGYNHLCHYDYSKQELRSLTKGNWDVDHFYGMDPVSGLAYFSAGDESPVSRNLFSIHTQSGEMKKLNSADGWNTASFTKGFRYYLHSWSKAGTPPVYSLCRANGEVVRVLQDNFILKTKLQDLKLGKMTFGKLDLDNGVNVNYYMISPPDFDPAKKYPVLMYVYGGPGSQTVTDSWGGAYYLWFNYLASKGYVVVSVDNRGTGARGEEFKKCTYQQLGKYEIEDQIAAAKKLGEMPFIDPARIGIFGWSYGGYMSSLGISKGTDVFKCAIAVAPVTNWRYYDNIYTERYMRTPAENASGYDDNSPINHVSKIKGSYLIVHGTADDNVHFQNTVEMVDALIRAGVDFDSEFYPNKNHGIAGGNTRLHLFRRMSSYLFENL